MDVLLVTSEFPPAGGGIGMQAHALALSWSLFGKKVCVISPIDYVSKSEALSFDQKQPYTSIRYPKISLQPFQTLIRIVFCLYITIKIRPNILINSSYRPGLYTMLPQFLFGKKRICIGHGSEFQLKTKISQFLSNLCFSTATQIIAVSNYTKSLAIKEHPSKTIHVIHNGGDHKRFFPAKDKIEVRQKLGLPQNCFLLLTVGRMCQRKAQDLVLKSIAPLIQQGLNISYCIVGHPERIHHLQELAKQLQIFEHVYFNPQADFEHIPSFYQAADLYILPSRLASNGDNEGFGISIIEAALTGLASIGSAHSGIAEAIEHNHTGWIIEPENVDDLSERIQFCYANQHVLTKMGTQARTRALTSYTWDNVAQQYLQVIGL